MISSSHCSLNVSHALSGALVDACASGDTDAIEMLFGFTSSDRQLIRYRVAAVAAARGHMAVVDRLLQDARFCRIHCLEQAASEGKSELIERLMLHKLIDPTHAKNIAIQLAAQRGHVAVVERLLEDERVDPSANTNLAVRSAAEYRHHAVVDRLLEDDRVDAAVAIAYSLPEERKRFECRERLTEICIGLQDMQLPAWVTLQILDAARPWSTLQLHSKWALVCAAKHFHDRRSRQT